MNATEVEPGTWQGRDRGHGRSPRLRRRRAPPGGGGARPAAAPWPAPSPGAGGGRSSGSGRRARCRQGCGRGFSPYDGHGTKHRLNAGISIQCLGLHGAAALERLRAQAGWEMASGEALPSNGARISRALSRVSLLRFQLKPLQVPGTLDPTRWRLRIVARQAGFHMLFLITVGNPSVTVIATPDVLWTSSSKTNMTYTSGNPTYKIVFG